MAVLTFENHCLEGKLTFGDPFLDSGVVRPEKRVRLFENDLGIRKLVISSKLIGQPALGCPRTVRVAVMWVVPTQQGGGGTGTIRNGVVRQLGTH